MDDLFNRIWMSVSDSLSVQADRIVDYAGNAIVFAVLFVFAYALGWLASKIVRRVLMFRKLEEHVVKYGAMKSKLWSSMVKFLAAYTKWFVVAGVMTLTGISLLTDLVYPFMNQLFWFIVLVMIGFIVAGYISRFVRDMSMDFGWEERLVKYGLADALGDIPITGLITGIVKWYVILIFVAQGVALFRELPVLAEFMNGLMGYVPQALLGGLIMVLALLIADYAGDRIKQKKVGFSETLALFAETVIVFLGLVIALPHFGVQDTSVLKDSFLIIVAGISIAIAIAFGLGMKDSVARLAKKYEEKL